MTAIEINAAVARAMARKKATQVTETTSKVAPVVTQTVQAVGGVSSPAMSKQDVLEALGRVHGVTAAPWPQGIEDGTRVHIHYKSFGTPTSQAIKCATRAEELGLPRDRYTGRVHRVWTSKDGDQLITLWVELERDHMYRTLNLDRGEVYRFVVLGE
jgi:hypothetical protein